MLKPNGLEILIAQGQRCRVDDLIKLVKTYRVSNSLPERLLLAEKLVRIVEPELRLFVFSNIKAVPAAKDVLQEAMKAIVCSLGKFKGNAAPAFWAWCYRIARNKICDHLRDKTADRIQPMPPDELQELVEQSEQTSPLSLADRLDLEHAMKLLIESKPECYDYLWNHFVFGLAYAEIAEQRQLTYDAVRMKIGRCLAEAQALVRAQS